MSIPAKQPAKKGGGWGSMFTSAVAGLESRLDTILADEPDQAARQRLVDQAQKDGMNRQRAGSGNLATAGTTLGRSNSAAGRSRSGSRDASRTRGGNSERLAERLARATAQKKVDAGSAMGSEPVSRVGSPAVGVGGEGGSPRGSSEGMRTVDAARSVPEEKFQNVEGTELEDAQDATAETSASGGEMAAEPSTLLNSGLPINPARHSTDSNARPSLDTPSRGDTASSRQSSELVNGSRTSKSANELEAEITRMRISHEQAEKQRQEEMHAHLERIDALQAKLQYLAKETVAAAKEANAATASGSADFKLAKKDERIALLMEEGEKLSKTELRHLQTIKKLRAKITEEEKGATEQRRKLERAERAESELKQKLRRSEAAERQAAERGKQVGGLEKQITDFRDERDKAIEQAKSLTAQLKAAEKKAEQAQNDAASRAAESDKSKIAELENELEDAQIEKKLAEDRAKSEIRKAKEEVDRQRERGSVRETELKNEIAGLDSRLEAMRARVEEAGSDSGAASEGSVNLMRQVETLQSQYGLAKSNWETIEGSLNARLSALEKERDEASKREADIRKKARDAATRTRKAEEDAESANDKISSLTADLQAQQQQWNALQKSFEQAETALADAQADADRQRRIWDSELNNRVEEEKARWQRQHHMPGGLRTTSPTTATTRKFSSPSGARRPTSSNRIASQDLGVSTFHNSSRRNSNFPVQTPMQGTQRDTPPSLSRQESQLSFDHSNIPPTPSIEIEADFDIADRDENAASPQCTLADLVSTSTAAAGPSVQLVERMSAAVRRLESEKATFKDELARLSAQRDEARDEIVALMREVEAKRASEGVERELQEVKKRYEACLGLLGEKEEEVEELRGDVVELKAMYRELVEKKVGGA